MKIRNKVKYFRILNGLTQDELAKKIGGVKSTICNIERGNCEGLTMKRAYMIAGALNIDISKLFFYSRDELILTMRQCEHLSCVTGVLIPFDKEMSHSRPYDSVMKLF